MQCRRGLPSPGKLRFPGKIAKEEFKSAESGLNWNFVGWLYLDVQSWKAGWKCELVTDLWLRGVGGEGGPVPWAGSLPLLAPSPLTSGVASRGGGHETLMQTRARRKPKSETKTAISWETASHPPPPTGPPSLDCHKSRKHAKMIKKNTLKTSSPSE